MRPMLYLLIGLCILSVSCFPGQRPQMVLTEGEAELKASRDEIWQAVLRAAENSDLPGLRVDGESGLIESELVILSPGKESLESVAMVPDVFLADWSEIQYRMRFVVTRKSRSTTLLKITAIIEAYDSNSTRTWYICDSNGKLEAPFFDAVSRNLGQ